MLQTGQHDGAIAPIALGSGGGGGVRLLSWFVCEVVCMHVTNISFAALA